MSLMLYDDIWMDATYVIFCVAWMQILDSNIPSIKQMCPQVEPDVDHVPFMFHHLVDIFVKYVNPFCISIL